MTYAEAYASLWERCPDHLREAGEQWYPLAMTEVEIGCPTASPIRLASVAAHLSPRLSWAECVRATHALTNGKARPRSIMTGSWSRALLAWDADDPLTTFSKAATKTEPFARAMAGDLNAAVIDTHMIHAGLGYRPGYGHLSSAEYRRLFGEALTALRRLSMDVGVPAAPLQAALWLTWKETKTNMEVTVQ